MYYFLKYLPKLDILINIDRESKNQIQSSV
jgi:hypothetical protein